MNKNHLSKISSILQKHFGSQQWNKNMINIIGYGSGVMPQSQSTQEILTNTIDIIIEVRDRHEFHHKHYSLKPADYSGLSFYLGKYYLDFLQNWIFPIHFNHIELEGHKIKYSIIDSITVRKDLINWNILCIAGRLHKPVYHFTQSRSDFEQILYKNRSYALGIALILSAKSKKISYLELYMKICQLSYMGDIRFLFKMQNPKKIQNIVKNNFEQFNKIYLSMIKLISQQIPKSVSIVSPDVDRQLYGEICITYSPEFLQFILLKSHLPSNIYALLEDQYSTHFKGELSKQVLMEGGVDLAKNLQRTIQKINRISSIKMVIESFLGGSLLTNLKYILRKLRKGMQ